MNPMTVQDAIAQRRSIKWYDPEHTMSAADFNSLMEHAILSPTAFNIQNWRFVRVDDRDKRQAIFEASGGQQQVLDASVLLVLCFDLKAWERKPERYWTEAPAEVRDYILPALDQYYRGREQVERDEGMRSCGIVAMSLMLMARQLGYDTCPMDGFDFDAVGKIINLPANHGISMMLAIGKKTRDPWPRPGQLPLADVLHRDRFPD